MSIDNRYFKKPLSVEQRSDYVQLMVHPTGFDQEVDCVLLSPEVMCVSIKPTAREHSVVKRWPRLFISNTSDGPVVTAYQLGRFDELTEIETKNGVRVDALSKGVSLEAALAFHKTRGMEPLTIAESEMRPLYGEVISGAEFKSTYI